MKRIFTIILLLSLGVSYGQKSTYQSLNRPIPNSWYNESSIILSQNEQFELEEIISPNSYAFNYENKLVIRLNDMASIEKYNSIEFPKYFFLDIEVVNKDGSNVKVVEGIDDYWNSKNSLTMDNPEKFYELVEESSNEKRKYAIPDLDTGDIIIIKTSFSEKRGFQKPQLGRYRTNIITMFIFYPMIPLSFKQFTNSFNEKYLHSYYEFLNLNNVFKNKENTLYKNVEITIHDKLYANFEVNNGCKPFTIKKEKSDSKIIYSISDSFLVKHKPEIWSSEYLDAPNYSFKVFNFSRKSFAKDKEIFVSGDHSLTKINKKQVKQYYKRCERFLHVRKKHKFKDYHAKNPKAKSILDPKKYIFEYLNFKKLENFYDFLQKDDDNYRVSFYSKELIFDLVYIAKRFLLPYNVYLIVPKEFGKLEDISSVDKFRYAIEIRFKSGPITFYGSEINSLGLIKPAYISGAGAYKIKGANYSNIQGFHISKIVLPEITEIEHGTSTQIYIDLNPDTTRTKINRITSYFGSNRNKLQYSQNFIYYFIDSIINNSKEINQDFLVLDPSIYKNDFSDNDLFEENERLINSFRINANEYFKQSSLEKLSEEFIVSKVDTSFLDFSDYLNDNLNPIHHTEVFSIEGFSYKTNNGIVINLGTLIESQVDLVDEDDRVRTNRIVQPNLRKFENKIIINLPKGYKPIGLDNFKFNIENEVGSFTSIPTFIDGKLEILVTKSYKKIFADKELWSSYLEFLDAANDFNYKKLILVKN